MQLIEAYDDAMTSFDRLVGRIGENDWGAPTPCTEWTVRDLLNHMVAEQLWVPELLAGATVDDVGDRYDGDVLGDDPVGRWRMAAKEAHEAVLRPGALDRSVHLSRGLIPASEYGWELTLDLVVHGWDLARGIDIESPIDSRLAATLLVIFRDKAELGRKLGVFGARVPVGPDDDPPTRLIALLGRQP